MTRKKKRALIIFFIVFAFSIIVILMAPILAIHVANTKYIDRIYEEDPLLKYDSSRYPDVIRTEKTFTSNHKHPVHYFIYDKKEQPTNYHGVIVFAHSFFIGGHSYFIDPLLYFLKNDYKIIGIDFTGNGASNETTMRGFQQGVIDLEYFLNEIEKDPTFNNYPIFLMGHSWGGYCVGAVLNKYQNVAGVIQIAGFNDFKSVVRSIIEIQKPKYLSLYNLLYPYLGLYQKMQFHDYARLNCVEGFKKTKANILLITSEMDTTIPSKAGPEYFMNIFKNNSRFAFKKYKDKYHELYEIKKDMANEAFKFVALYQRIFYANFIPRGTAAEKEKMIRALFDSEEYKNRLDYEFLDMILTFMKNTINHKQGDLLHE